MHCAYREGEFHIRCDEDELVSLLEGLMSHQETARHRGEFDEDIDRVRATLELVYWYTNGKYHTNWAKS